MLFHRVVARHRAPRAPWSTGAAVATMCTAGLIVGSVALASDTASARSPIEQTTTQPARVVQKQAQALLAARAVATDELSRSSDRPALHVQTSAAKSPLPFVGQRLGGVNTSHVPPPTPRQLAAGLLSSYGWDSGQFSCLDAVWTRESDWNPYAANSTSGAYGIPQALPGAKMATSGADWQSNAETQIKWGLGYIRASYGSPCGAWAFWQSHGWY